MANGTATFGCIASNGAIGSKTVQWSVALNAIVDTITTTNSSNLPLLQVGDNTINIPSGTTYAVIKIPATQNNGAIVTLKGDPGDRGIVQVANTNQDFFAVLLVLGNTSIILNATAAVPGVEVNFL